MTSETTLSNNAHVTVRTAEIPYNWGWEMVEDNYTFKWFDGAQMSPCCDFITMKKVNESGKIDEYSYFISLTFLSIISLFFIWMKETFDTCSDNKISNCSAHFCNKFKICFICLTFTFFS